MIRKRRITIATRRTNAEPVAPPPSLPWRTVLKMIANGHGSASPKTAARIVNARTAKRAFLYGLRYGLTRGRDFHSVQAPGLSSAPSRRRLRRRGAFGTHLTAAPRRSRARQRRRIASSAHRERAWAPPGRAARPPERGRGCPRHRAVPALRAARGQDS